MMMLALTMLLTAAAAPPAPLTPAQRRAMGRLFVCPADLPDDAARDAAMKRFLGGYAKVAPRARPAEALAFHAALATARKCRQTDAQLIHTVPEI